MINQLDACKLEDDKVFHIHMELHGNAKSFIEKSPNLSAWEIYSLKKMSATRHLDIRFNNMDTIIETMCYCYDNINELRVAYIDNRKFKKSEGGGGSENKY